MRYKRDIKMGRLCTPGGEVIGIVGGGVTLVGEKRGYWLIPQRPLISTKNSFFPNFFCLNQQKQKSLTQNPILRMRSSTTFPC